MDQIILHHTSTNTPDTYRWIVIGMESYCILGFAYTLAVGIQLMFWHTESLISLIHVDILPLIIYVQKIGKEIKHYMDITLSLLLSRSWSHWKLEWAIKTFVTQNSRDQDTKNQFNLVNVLSLNMTGNKERRLSCTGFQLWGIQFTTFIYFSFIFPDLVVQGSG